MTRAERWCAACAPQRARERARWAYQKKAQKYVTCLHTTPTGTDAEPQRKLCTAVARTAGCCRVQSGAITSYRDLRRSGGTVIAVFGRGSLSPAAPAARTLDYSYRCYLHTPAVQHTGLVVISSVCYNMMPAAGRRDRASILEGEGDMIFQLMCSRATSEQWAEWLRAPLEHAAGTGNHDLVEKLLKAGSNGGAGWRGCDDSTLLHAAAEGGNAQIVSALITAGAGQDMKARASATGNTPLHLAVAGGREAAAGALIMAGADVNVLNDKEEAPLHLAIVGGHAKLAKDLLFSGADPSQKSKGHYPIHRAVRHGMDEVVRALVLKRVDLNCLDFLERTPLVVAVQEGRVSTLRVLLDGGADASFRNNVSKPALHVAAQLNRAATIPALVEAGGNVEARSTSGQTPLIYSAMLGSCAAMLALLQLGASVHTKMSNGWTPLHIACEEGQADAADLLLTWGADETAVTKHGKTPSAVVPPIAGAAHEDRLRLERLSTLLANAPHRAWRRRGFLIMCRAYPDRVRLLAEIPHAVAEVIEQRPKQRSKRRARRDQVKVEVRMGGGGGGEQNGEQGWGAGSNARTGRMAGRGGAGRIGFDGLAAWLMAMGDEDVFRKIVGFL